MALPAEERAERLRELGAALYASDGGARCETCHGPEGRGIRGAIPPLVAERPWSRDCTELVSIVLFGSNELFSYDGLTYAGVMPPLASALDDLQVAAVSSSVIGRFGRGGACEPVDVDVVRMQGPMSRLE